MTNQIHKYAQLVAKSTVFVFIHSLVRKHRMKWAKQMKATTTKEKNCVIKNTHILRSTKEWSNKSTDENGKQRKVQQTNKQKIFARTSCERNVHHMHTHTNTRRKYTYKSALTDTCAKSISHNIAWDRE